MLVKINGNLAVDRDEVEGIYGETVGIERRRTQTVIRMKNGKYYVVYESPVEVMKKLGIE